ncbi:hypothetical protein W911_13045 [Hyphomicrobium nitrativorans NL23]|uniref:Uncharacterized protein n=2 Tax=Hyphomicrobium TaxID=81 RepID=V5SHC0_9HYPH|nr:hypothetical protein W911_13045 [Hyphomicrobium nitrativorans NL23]
MCSRGFRRAPPQSGSHPASPRALAKLRPLGVSVDREQISIVDVALLATFVEWSDRGEEGF